MGWRALKGVVYEGNGTSTRDARDDGWWEGSERQCGCGGSSWGGQGLLLACRGWPRQGRLAEVDCGAGGRLRGQQGRLSSGRPTYYSRAKRREGGPDRSTHRPGPVPDVGRRRIVHSHRRWLVGSPLTAAGVVTPTNRQHGQEGGRGLCLALPECRGPGLNTGVPVSKERKLWSCRLWDRQQCPVCHPAWRATGHDGVRQWWQGRVHPWVPTTRLHFPQVRDHNWARHCPRPPTSSPSSVCARSLLPSDAALLPCAPIHSQVDLQTVFTGCTAKQFFQAVYDAPEGARRYHQQVDKVRFAVPCRAVLRALCCQPSCCNNVTAAL